MSSRDEKTGHYLPDAELQRPPGSAGNLKLGPKAVAKKAAEKRRTEREFLAAIVEEVSTDDAREIAVNVVKRAKEGDKDALAWIGKFLLGGGKVSLDDIANPPMIRKTK